MEGRCKNCRYWLSIGDYAENTLEEKRWISTVGKCEKIMSKSKIPAIGDLEHGELPNAITYSHKENIASGLLTKDNFGCILFENKLMAQFMEIVI